jgi:Holliday junction resolvase
MVKKEVVPFLLRDGSREEAKKDKSHRRMPKAQESRVAAAIGGLRQPGSGAFDHHKGDVKKSHGDFPLLVECKRTSGQKTLRLDSVWLAKITREAHARASYPALSIEFDEDIVRQLDGSPEATWVALPLSVLRGLLEKAGETVDL